MNALKQVGWKYKINTCTEVPLNSSEHCFCTSLASQTHFRKRGKGLVNSVYKPCPGALHSAPQSRCSILSHDALHHCFSSNSNLENSKREPGHLSRYYRNCKNTWRIVFRERAYPATGNSRVHYLKSGYVIQLIAFRWDKACIRSSPDPSLSCGSGSGLRDYFCTCSLYRNSEMLQNGGAETEVQLGVALCNFM